MAMSSCSLSFDSSSRCWRWDYPEVTSPCLLFRMEIWALSIYSLCWIFLHTVASISCLMGSCVNRSSYCLAALPRKILAPLCSAYLKAFSASRTSPSYKACWICFKWQFCPAHVLLKCLYEIINLHWPFEVLLCWVSREMTRYLSHAPLLVRRWLDSLPYPMSASANDYHIGFYIWIMGWTRKSWSFDSGSLASGIWFRGWSWRFDSMKSYLNSKITNTFQSSAS